MMGEELGVAAVEAGGLSGDRVYAIVDPETGKVASAKNPKKWPSLFDCHARFVEDSGTRARPGRVRVTLPDGSALTSDENGFDAAISAMLGRQGRLQSAVPEQPILEEYWPDIEGLALRETVTDESLPDGTFFDLAPVHLLSTETLDSLRAAYPSGRFESRRFRPNIVVAAAETGAAYPEEAWVGRTIALGDEVELRVTMPCGRCVMTTLPQGDLPRDPGILRAAAQSNDAHVGVYAEVITPGTVRRGDAVRLI
jgi:uncharacterized protein YcbX